MRRWRHPFSLCRASVMTMKTYLASHGVAAGRLWSLGFSPGHADSSIDLQSGHVVQLVQGERSRRSSDDLDGWIEKFSGFPVVQVIDLDAAKDAGSNRDLVRYICERLPCRCGGIRSPEPRARFSTTLHARHCRIRAVHEQWRGR